ncbi:MAG TPA: hypothetical protein VF960_00645 [Chloroflexota bacterium]
MWRRERFDREREAVRSYLQVAAPLGLRASKLYETWREAVAEPVQDNQKAANASATFWWRVTEGLRRFEALTPPEPAARYHKHFAEAMKSASLGSEAAKNGFRAGKSYEVSRGLGLLDLFVKQMEIAENELGRLVVNYKLLDETAPGEYDETEEPPQ